MKNLSAKMNYRILSWSRKNAQNDDPRSETTHPCQLSENCQLARPASELLLKSTAKSLYALRVIEILTAWEKIVPTSGARAPEIMKIIASTTWATRGRSSASSGTSALQDRATRPSPLFPESLKVFYGESFGQNELENSQPEPKECLK